jgi:hypothetical protein
VTDNDDPECCGGQPDCADKSDDVNDTFSVSFPEGCGGAGAHDSSVHWVSPEDDYASLTCSTYGKFERYSATYDVDYKYDDCSWVCEISNVQAKTKILVRAPNSLLPDDVSVESASDVPCDDAALAKSDLDDTDLTDDVGAPRCKYWCYIASVAHEEKHRYDWQTFYAEELGHAVANVESGQINIDCANPDTITCQAAENSRQSSIDNIFLWASIYAARLMNNPDTSLNEDEQRAYEISYEIEQPISAALPEGCTP